MPILPLLIKKTPTSKSTTIKQVTTPLTRLPPDEIRLGNIVIKDGQGFSEKPRTWGGGGSSRRGGATGGIEGGAGGGVGGGTGGTLPSSKDIILDVQPAKPSLVETERGRLSQISQRRRRTVKEEFQLAGYTVGATGLKFLKDTLGTPKAISDAFAYFKKNPSELKNVPSNVKNQILAGGESYGKMLSNSPTEAIADIGTNLALYYGTGNIVGKGVKLAVNNKVSRAIRTAIKNPVAVQKITKTAGKIVIKVKNNLGKTKTIKINSSGVASNLLTKSDVKQISRFIRKRDAVTLERKILINSTSKSIYNSVIKNLKKSGRTLNPTKRRILLKNITKGLSKRLNKIEKAKLQTLLRSLSKGRIKSIARRNKIISSIKKLNRKLKKGTFIQQRVLRGSKRIASFKVPKIRIPKRLVKILSRNKKAKLSLRQRRGLSIIEKRFINKSTNAIYKLTQKKYALKMKKRLSLSQKAQIYKRIKTQVRANYNNWRVKTEFKLSSKLRQALKYKPKLKAKITRVRIKRIRNKVPKGLRAKIKRFTRLKKAIKITKYELSRRRGRIPKRRLKATIKRFTRLKKALKITKYELSRRRGRIAPRVKFKLSYNKRIIPRIRKELYRRRNRKELIKIVKGYKEVVGKSKRNFLKNYKRFVSNRKPSSIRVLNLKATFPKLSYKAKRLKVIIEATNKKKVFRITKSPEAKIKAGLKNGSLKEVRTANGQSLLIRTKQLNKFKAKKMKVKGKVLYKFKKAGSIPIAKIISASSVLASAFMPPKSMSASAVAFIGKTGNVQLIVPKVKQDSATKGGYKSANAPAQTTAQKSAQKTAMRFKTTGKSKPAFARGKQLFFKLPKKSQLRKKAIAKTNNIGFNVYGKSWGKVYKLNKKPLSQKDALNRGSYAIDNTTARTFFIKPIGKTRSLGKVKPKEANYFNKVKGKFRGYKVHKKKQYRLTNKAIEKKRYLIDTRGEKRGLRLAKFVKQMKGGK